MENSRGSEWRRWDLHVHTPESGMGNNFQEDWDIYVLSLFNKALEKGISVIGITDYFTIDGALSYVSGSLENADINREICRILEGGKEAFEKREKKYGFQ